MAMEQTPELERILQEAADRGASDVHLVPGEPVSFRVRGAIERAEADPLTAAQVRAIAAAAVGDQALEQIPSATGGAITSCGLPGVVDGRIAVARALGDCTLTIRILPGVVLDVQAAGMPDAMLQAAQAPHGLIIFAGQTGSGKSTAAYSLLDHINATRPVHIYTIEDPVAARLTPKRALVQQREIGSDVPDTIAGLRCALTQDVDVLFIGQLTTVAEVQAAVTAADAGHLVIVVGHASSPEDMIQRLLDIQPPEARGHFAKRLASVLRAVSVQCLLPKAAGRGRVAAYGVLVPDDQTRRAIIEAGSLAERTGPLPPGSRTLADDIRRLEAEGIVSPEAAAKALAAL